MNVMRIVKELMNLKILTESKLINTEVRRYLKTHKDKIIELDSDEEILGKKTELIRYPSMILNAKDVG